MPEFQTHHNIPSSVRGTKLVTSAKGGKSGALVSTHARTVGVLMQTVSMHLRKASWLLLKGELEGDLYIFCWLS